MSQRLAISVNGVARSGEVEPHRLVLHSAAQHATEGQAVASDIHADAEYRAALAVTLTRRAIERARARAGSPAA